MNAVLEGWTVLVPRARHQSAQMCSDLERLGADVLAIPTLEIVSVPENSPLDSSLVALKQGRFSWIVFTSVNAIEQCEQHSPGLMEFLNDAHCKVAVVGEKTCQAAQRYGAEPDLSAPQAHQNAAGLVSVFPQYDPDGPASAYILLPRAQIATRVLPEGLSALGWVPEDVVAYNTVPARQPSRGVVEQINSGGVDAILFTSSSTATNLLSFLPGGTASQKIPSSTIIGALGPHTRETLERAGLRVDVEPTQASSEALVEALADYAHGLPRPLHNSHDD